MTLASSTKVLASISCFCNGQGPVSVLNIVIHTHMLLYPNDVVFGMI